MHNQLIYIKYIFVRFTLGYFFVPEITTSNYRYLLFNMLVRKEIPLQLYFVARSKRLYIFDL